MYFIVFSFNETIPKEAVFKEPGLLVEFSKTKFNGRILKTLKRTASFRAILIPLQYTHE